MKVTVRNPNIPSVRDVFWPVRIGFIFGRAPVGGGGEISTVSRSAVVVARGAASARFHRRKLPVLRLDLLFPAPLLRHRLQHERRRPRLHVRMLRHRERRRLVVDEAVRVLHRVALHVRVRMSVVSVVRVVHVVRVRMMRMRVQSLHVRMLTHVPHVGSHVIRVGAHQVLPRFEAVDVRVGHASVVVSERRRRLPHRHPPVQAVYVIFVRHYII